MLAGAPEADAVPGSEPSVPKIRSRLFTKYVALFVAVVGVALLSNGIFEVFFYYREHKVALIRIQREQAEAAAAKIGQFVKEIESQLGWTTQLPWSAGSIEQRRFDALRLLRQVPAITELAQVDSTGKERLRVSRLAMDVVDSGLDLSKDSKFTEAVARKVYYGPVYFRRESEPYMTLALAGTRKDAGVSIAEVNLKLIWDVVSQIKVGERGHAYVVGAQGRLIAHPDISLVLRNTDMSKLLQVQAAQAGQANSGPDALEGTRNIQGQEVLTASAPITPLGWTMFVELPVAEAYASLYQALQRLALVLLGALGFAVFAGIFLARRMVVPIQALRAGAERIGSGDFDQRISIKTGDELEGLANQFNDMGARLHESYADLERKVEVRTAELSETLQQQTATADILKVIASSPDDVQPVFQAIADRSNRLVNGLSTTVLSIVDDTAHLSAFTRTTPDADAALQAYFPRSLSEMPFGETVRRGEIFRLLDTHAEPALSELARLRGYRSMLFVPLLHDGMPIGMIGQTKAQPGPFAENHVQLLKTFADQAVIAIQNVRLFDEVQARTEDLGESLQQQTATADVLKVISRSVFDLDLVLNTLVQTGMKLCEAEQGVIWMRRGEQLHLSTSGGYPQEWIEHSQNNPITPAPDSATVSGRVAASGQYIMINDIHADERFGNNAYHRAGQYRAVLMMPLLRGSKVEGTIGFTRSVPGSFSQRQIELVQTFADQAVIAIENARLFDEVQERTRELSLSLEDLRTAQDRLVQTEKLASLGQLTAGIAHEIKNPLNFVNNFSALSADLIDELNDVLKPAALDDKTREEIDELTHMLKGNLEKVVQHGKRADSIVKNMLLHSREGSGDHRPADINAIVEESLNLAYHGARAEKPNFNVTLQRNFDSAAGMIDLFPQEITRVLLNLITNGFYATAKRKEAGEDGFEPTLSAITRNLGNNVEIRIRDNGTGIPPEVKEKMFNPFFTTKPAGEGTGLGLSMSHDIIVKQHNGTINVETEPGAFTEFIITLPRMAAAKTHSGGKN